MGQATRFFTDSTCGFAIIHSFAEMALVALLSLSHFALAHMKTRVNIIDVGDGGTLHHYLATYNFVKLCSKHEQAMLTAFQEV